jgi:hypothetical protein
MTTIKAKRKSKKEKVTFKYYFLTLLFALAKIINIEEITGTKVTNLNK